MGNWFYLNLVWKFFITVSAIDNQVSTFTITDTKLSVSVVILSTQDNATLLQQL